MTYYWLSFCDTERPAGEQFTGGCIVEADSDADAVKVAYRRQCNPGGEVVVIEITPEYEPNVTRFEHYRLYSKQEIIDMGEYRTLDAAVAEGDAE